MACVSVRTGSAEAGPFVYVGATLNSPPPASGGIGACHDRARRRRSLGRSRPIGSAESRSSARAGSSLRTGPARASRRRRNRTCGPFGPPMRRRHRPRPVARGHDNRSLRPTCPWSRDAPRADATSARSGPRPDDGDDQTSRQYDRHHGRVEGGGSLPGDYQKGRISVCISQSRCIWPVSSLGIARRR